VRWIRRHPRADRSAGDPFGVNGVAAERAGT